MFTLTTLLISGHLADRVELAYDYNGGKAALYRKLSRLFNWRDQRHDAAL
jgi:hypothetical protein